jgi:hypothetical protein
MKSSTTPSFWRAYRALPPEIQIEAERSISFGKQTLVTPRFTSNAKEIYWSVRITKGWRALARDYEGTLYWFWIGSHDEYERRLKTLKTYAALLKTKDDPGNHTKPHEQNP